MTILKRIGYFVALPLLLVALWWALTLNTNSFWVPRPGQLVETFGEVWIGPRFDATSCRPSCGSSWDWRWPSCWASVSVS